MANVEDLLRKQKDRIEKIDPSITPSATRKKTARTGPSRPWQENLPQYQKNLPGTETDKEDEVIKFAVNASPESGSNLVQNGFITGSESSPNLVHNKFTTSSNSADSEGHLISATVGTDRSTGTRIERAKLATDDYDFKSSINKIKKAKNTFSHLGFGSPKALRWSCP